jgi:ABC-type uncharacterized transport system substrate-binding protein
VIVMNVREQARSGLLALVLATVAGVSPAASHPHAWIDLRSTVIVGSDGHITALEQEWLFDRLYTLLATQGLDEEPSARLNALTELARSNLAKLQPHGYFIHARADEAKVDVAPVTAFETAVRHERLWLRFVAPLVTPVDPRRQAFVFAVFDPSYFIEMRHIKDEPILFRNEGSNACHGDIHTPQPTVAALALASALDRNAKAPESFGELFAEQVTVTCR